MDLSNSDLEEYVEKLENVFLNQKSNKKHRHELTLLIENISSELNASRKSENALRDDFKKLIDSADFDINRKYVLAEEKCSKQENEIISLNIKVVELENQAFRDLENQKSEFLNKIQNIEEKLGSEIVNLKSQLDSQRICHEIKERELYNEMQMMQAASALEWDEKESNFKKQLIDISSNFRLAQSKIRSMQCEINQLKTQLSMLKCPPRDSTTYPQPTPMQLLKNQIVEKKLHDMDSFDYNYINQHYTNVTTETRCLENLNELSRSTARNLNISAPVQEEEEVEEVIGKKSPEKIFEQENTVVRTPNIRPMVEVYAPVVFKGKKRSKTNYLLPPLKPTTTNNSNSNVGFSNVTRKEMQRKKRKLYDPDIFDHPLDE